MTAVESLTLGAPNIYRVPDEMRRTLGGVRMDVCAFVGVAPRGAVRIPIEPEAALGDRVYVDPVWPRRRSLAVAVESWDDYRREFGGFAGPGRLPYAVASFFEQGGRKAYIVRIVHDYPDSADDLAAVAQGRLSGLVCSAGDVLLEARNEGSWGNALQSALGFSTTPVAILEGSSAGELLLDLQESMLPGALLRISVPAAGDSIEYQFRFVAQVMRDGLDSQGDRLTRLVLDSPLPAEPLGVELVEAELLIDDGTGVSEQFKRLGLSPLHPRFLGLVLYRESRLLYPHHSWVESDLLPASAIDLPANPQRLIVTRPDRFSGGEDRYAEIVPEDFFDAAWVMGQETPGDGVHALTLLTDLASVVAPDLYLPEPLPEAHQDETPVSLASGRFAPCRAIAPATEPLASHQVGLEGLLLDPTLPADFEAIVSLQKRLVELAERTQGFVALLDVPLRLSQQQILKWRSRFRSSYAAAYHPWLEVSRGDDAREGLLRLNPSAVAAGIIARQELTFGVPHGPANVIAANIVKVAERVSPQRHDALHPLGINVYLQERDGAWLSAGRTLSRDARYRQLSVRRLMIMLRRALQQQMQWSVFEPNTPALWAEVRRMLTAYLRQLFVAGAFRGENETEAFFVRCDGELNHRRIIDAGQMIAEIGVAPAEPLEFIAVRITRGGDGTLAMES